MSSKVDFIRTFIDTAWTKPPSSVMEANSTYLSDDFKSIDKDGKVLMDKEAYIGMAHQFVSAFTDMKWIRSDLHQEGEGVIMSGHFEGKHTGDLDLSALGLGIVPASNKMIVWPEASVEYMVEGDKIVSEKAYGGGSGLEALLSPLGVTLPSA